MSASNDEVKNISWNEKLEEYFASTGEKAHCLGWLHKRSEAYFSLASTWIDLPVIIISTIVGATSIGSKGLFGDAEFASVGLGIISIFVSILNVVGTYFAWSRRAEAHRISYIQYSRMYRYISVEMSLPREERTKPFELLRYTRVEYDRLSEISPLIPPKIIKEFNLRFSHEKEISQPEEVNGLEKIDIYIPNSLYCLDSDSQPEKELPVPAPPSTPVEEFSSESVIPTITINKINKAWR
jgi:hypothetical protein